jgi:hypothetical protein
MIPDYTPPEGWRVVRYGDLPINHLYKLAEDAEPHPKLGTLAPDRPVLVRVDPPFDFNHWSNKNCTFIGVGAQRASTWDRIEPVAEHVQIRDPWSGDWYGAADAAERAWSEAAAGDSPAAAVFVVREKT